MQREDYFNNIATGLSALSAHIEINGSLNLLSSNVHAEYFFRDFLNILCDYNLENTNFFKKNYPSIDLIDESTKVAFQVTSDSSFTKTESTVKKFVENSLHKKCKTLIILNIIKASKHKKKEIKMDDFIFDTQNQIWDKKTLGLKLVNLKIEKLKMLSELVSNEIRTLIPNNFNPPDTIQPSNIQRILEGISNLDIRNDVYTPKTKPYTILDKIDHNNIIIYSKYYDVFYDNSITVRARLDFLEQNGFASITSKIFTYVQTKYFKFMGKFTPDEIIKKISTEIEIDLKHNNYSKITVDDTMYVPFVVFFVFSECHIFDAPLC